MFIDLSSAVCAELVRVMPELIEEDLDLNADLSDDYGLTSLGKVLFLTSVCDTLQVSLTTFTELDLADLRTLADVVEAMAHRRQAVGTVPS